MVKPPVRTKSIGTKVSDEEYAQLEKLAQSHGQTLGEWCRDVMLGHADLQSTQIYTQVSIGRLKRIHEATHPGASLEKKKPASVSVAASEEESRKANLLAVLDVEAEEDGEEPDGRIT